MTSLDLEGSITSNTLTLSRRKPTNNNQFNIRINRCDAKVNCYPVHIADYDNVSTLSITDDVFTKCTTYNVRLETVIQRTQTIRDEISITNRKVDCWLTNEIMLVIIFSAVMVLLIFMAFLVCYYHSKNVRRVRSRLYSRLYSQERYQKVIKISDFKNIMELKLKEDAPFSDEFERLEKLAWDTIERRTSVAEIPSNRRRNRYKDIFPFDYNRVPVFPYKISGDSEPSDYINASFVSDVFSGAPKKYIAAQGPGQDTTPAFWEMIWQYNVRVVVMLTNVVEGTERFTSIKCNKYWPDNVGDAKKFGDLKVQLFDRAEAPNYCVRKLDVTKTGGLAGGENRVIIHLQLTDWPDRAAPGHAGHLVQLTQLTQVMLNTQTGTGGPQVGGPLLVHCSAGVGRTGTFICVDQMINNINNNSSPSSEIDIFHTVYQLRKQRVYMVQTREQYEYLYKCIQHHLEMKQKQKKISHHHSPSLPVSPV